jgi:hypothetical protein
MLLTSPCWIHGLGMRYRVFTAEDAEDAEVRGVEIRTDQGDYIVNR